MNAECKFCAALHRARELELFDSMPELCSPLTPGVQLVNLSYSHQGQMLRVDLGGHWKRMFCMPTREIALSSLFIMFQNVPG